MTNKKRNAITLLCILGLILSINLVYIYIKINFMSGAPKSYCSVSDFIDCDGVARTEKAFVLGVPLAIWGVILYCLFLFLTWVDKIREKINFPLLNVFKNPSSYIATIGLFSFICSITLACISLFDIKKICILCFMTYFINLFISLFAVKGDFFITDIKNTVADFYAGAKQYLILFLVTALCAAGILSYLQQSLILAPNLKKSKLMKQFSDMKSNIYAIKGNYLGNRDGDVEIFVFGDFMCPFCRVTNIVLHKLVTEDPGLAVYHINYPLDKDCNPTVRMDIHPGACLMSRYALAAEKQGDYWGMVSAIYNTLPNNEAEIVSAAKGIGLDVEQLKKDAHSKEIAEILDNQVHRGIKESLIGTPTIFIDDIPHTQGISYLELKELIKQSRARHAAEK